MTELTQKLLTLDDNALMALRDAERSAEAAQQAARRRTDVMREEELERFARQKEAETAALAERMQRERDRLETLFRRRCEAAEKRTDAEALAESLLKKARERVCR